MMGQVQGWVLAVCLIGLISALTGALCGKGVGQALSTAAALAMVLASLFLWQENRLPFMQSALALPEQEDWEEQSRQKLQLSLDRQMEQAIRNEGESAGIDCTASVLSQLDEQGYRLTSLTLRVREGAQHKQELQNTLEEQYGLTAAQIQWKEDGT